MQNPHEHPLAVFARLAEESKQNDPRLAELVSAAQKGNIDEVRRWLAEGLSPNQLPPGGSDTAVWAAIFARKPDVVRVLAEAGADLNAGYPDTPLEVAATWGHVELVRALIAGGAEVDRPTESGQTPLRAAIGKGHTEVAIELVKAGADPTFAPPCSRYPARSSPLELIAFGAGGPVLEAMLAAPRDTPIDNLDAILLGGAAARGDAPEIKRLLASGTDVNRTHGGQTPLYVAAIAGQASAVKCLLAAGASVARTGAFSPLVAAAGSGKLAIVKMLIAGGATDFDEALRFAKGARHKKVVEYLLSLEPSDAKPDRPTGATTFDVNDSCLLVAAPVGDVSSAFQKLIGAKTRKTNMLGKRVKLAKRCYAVFRIKGQPWSIIMRLNSDIEHTFHKPADAAGISLTLKAPVMLVSSGDTASVYQLLRYEQGTLVELFDIGNADTVDLAGLTNVARDDRTTIASSTRQPVIDGKKNPLDVLNDYLKQQNAFVPFGFEELGDAGETVELTLEELGPDDIERLDYVAV